MRTDSRLSRVLHVLLHMARADEVFSSTRIAAMLKTNPTVVRRMMKGLREAGYVSSRHGKGGGWTLECDLRTTTLLDLYDALGQPTLFAMGLDTARHDCAVAQAVDGALGAVLEEARALVREQMSQTTLAMLADQFSAACDAGGWTLPDA